MTATAERQEPTALEGARARVRSIQPPVYSESAPLEDDTLCSEEAVLARIAFLVQTALDADDVRDFWRLSAERMRDFHTLNEAWMLLRKQPPVDAGLRLLEQVERVAGPAHRHRLEQAMNMFDDCVRLAKRLNRGVAPADRQRDEECARSFNSWLVVGSWLITCIARGLRRLPHNLAIYDELFHAAIRVAGEAAADASEGWRLRFGDPDDEE